MAVLDRAALEESPLADLHAIASELSIDGYRRLRRPALIDAILDSQGRGDGPSAEPQDLTDEIEEPSLDDEPDTAGERRDASEPVAPEDEQPAVAEDEQPAARRRRGRRGGRGRAAARDEAPATEEQDETDEREEGEPEPREEDETIEGVVELLSNGSGFVRVQPPDPSDDDVYISSAQVKRCELLSGDRVAGPRRAPRRSERFASLVRIDTINGQPAAELASGARFDDLPAAFPDERIRLASEDPTIKEIEWLTPFGKGSRVTIAGPSRAGKTEALRRLATVLAEHEELLLSVALAGVRPEEIPEWRKGGIEPTAAASFASSPDAQDHAVELVIDQARRLAARGAHAVVLVDTLDGLHHHAARKALAAARNIVDGGSLTVIATASEPIGGETTVIALDAVRASMGRFPAVNLAASGTIRPELLVGEAGAEAITRARAEALEGVAGDG